MKGGETNHSIRSLELPQRGGRVMRKLTYTSVVMALAKAFTFAGPAYADPKSGGKHCGGTQDKHPCTILVIPVHQM